MGKQQVDTSINSINILVSNTQVKGEIISDGDFRMDGTLIGNISIKGKLVVGSTGKIEGNIICQNADVSGIIVGNIIVEDLLIINASAEVDGDVALGKLSIEPGAKFSGKCEMKNS
ncbi:polymer-forming cytoskeletal protein [Bacteroidales bacterium OttesenSCG-928-C19]|nr:polymer-forming cytoskeletal protein [Bacteroidales bacterium OttesenSCG-928-C19]